MNPVENLGHGTAEHDGSDKNCHAAERGDDAMTIPTVAPSAPLELGRGDLVIVAASPKAGSGEGHRRISQVSARVAASGIEVVVESSLKKIVALVTQAITSQRPLCVAAAGGDGTLNLLASALPRHIPLMPFPLGTENLVARHYGLLSPTGVFDEQVAADTLIRGRLLRIDAGFAKFLSRRKLRRERMFLIMASVGFDADVVRRMHLTRRGHIRRWSYLKPILASLRRYHYPRIHVERLDHDRSAATSGAAATGETDSRGDDPLTVAWALLFNLPRYAVGLTICATADATDGKLDFCGLRYGSHVHSLRYLAGVLLGRHTTWADVTGLQGCKFRLSSSKPLAVQLDGDYAGRLPIEVRLEPQRVLLRLPRLGQSAT
jgi:diacylglycerol kinase family enzyme